MIILVHGFNVWDGGRSTVGKLSTFCGKHLILNYGHFGLLNARYKNDKVAKRLDRAVRAAELAGYKPTVIGHSNGCAIIHRAAEIYKTRIKKAVYINPALHRDIRLPASIHSVDVWHSPSDGPVRWAKFLPASDARPWGDMGAVGYQINSTRIRNLNKENGYPIKSCGHSDIFKTEKIAYFGPLIIKLALDE